MQQPQRPHPYGEPIMPYPHAHAQQPAPYQPAGPQLPPPNQIMQPAMSHPHMMAHPPPLGHPLGTTMATMGNSQYPMPPTLGPSVGMQLPRPNFATAPPPPPPPPGSQQQKEVQLSGGGNDGKYRYALSVEQQPQRARMCGFGDKDRRPITPPPCVRLYIIDAITEREVDFNEIDGSFFVLQVDLWSDDALREVNIVRAASGSPATSISTATTTSFPPTPERPAFGQMFGHHVIGADGQAHYVQQYPAGQQFGYQQAAFPPSASYIAASQPTNLMYTRNLIGSLTVNASRLNDPDGKTGYWFVLQDLSVRTEGWFRLKMNFINVGATNGSGGLNRGKAPVLAWVFSDKFQVYSAKKFPGVIESTPLSKCFAQQGIKIPIRKDAKNEDREDDD